MVLIWLRGVFCPAPSLILSLKPHYCFTAKEVFFNIFYHCCNAHQIYMLTESDPKIILFQDFWLWNSDSR